MHAYANATRDSGLVQGTECPVGTVHSTHGRIMANGAVEVWGGSTSNKGASSIGSEGRSLYDISRVRTCG